MGTTVIGNYFMNVSYEYDRWVIQTQLCKLRDTPDELIGRACLELKLRYIYGC